MSFSWEEHGTKYSFTTNAKRVYKNLNDPVSAHDADITNKLRELRLGNYGYLKRGR